MQDDPTKRRSACRARDARAIVLLEIIFAITLFAAMAGVVLSSLHSSINAVSRLRLDNRAADLAVTVLSQIQMGDLAPVDDGPNEFAEPLEDWTWQIVTTDLREPIEGAKIKRVEIFITNTAKDYTHHLAFLLASDDGGEGGSALSEPRGGGR